jgi:hypothetical protein
LLSILSEVDYPPFTIGTSDAKPLDSAGSVISWDRSSRFLVFSPFGFIRGEANDMFASTQWVELPLD